MTTLILTSSAPPVAKSSIITAPVTLLTTAAGTAATASAVSSHSVPTFVDVYNYCPKSHSLAEAAGVGIAVGAFVASIIILAFILIRRRSTRARKLSPTIAPDVLVRGPMVDNGGDWQEYREELMSIARGEGLKHKEPPTYTRDI